MSDIQIGADANVRERSPERQYILTIEQAAELYAKAGHDRTHRAIQKYCALGKLDCRKADTEIGVEKKYLIAPYSVERHIAYINEMRPVASVRVQSRTDANVPALENKGHEEARTPANSPEQPRTDANVRSDLDIFEHPYVKRLEAEVNEFKSKYEKQVERTEKILVDANSRLVAMAEANQIAGSKTLAEYLLAAKVVPPMAGEVISEH